MSFVKCFDVVSMVVEEGCNQFKPLWKIDQEKYKILAQYCSAIDKLSTEFNGVCFEVDVDDIAMTISITLTCKEMSVSSNNHPLVELLKKAASVSFGASEEEDCVDVKFVFPGIWERA